MIVSPFLPLQQMWTRVDESRNEPSVLLYELSYAAELLLKCVTLCLLAGLDEDRERHAYSLYHRLVRADGLGTWRDVLHECLEGPAAEVLSPALHRQVQELRDQCQRKSWQYDSAVRLHGVLHALGHSEDPFPDTVDGARWLDEVVTLRNKTRAHGAPKPGQGARVCADLEDSIRRFQEGTSLLALPSVYLQRSLSGKYRLLPLTQSCKEFDELKTSAGRGTDLGDGCYVFVGEYRRIRLLEVESPFDPEAVDFLVPNGDFTKKSFEMLSYATDDRKEHASQEFLASPKRLPESETRGKPSLDVQGESWGNLPSRRAGYVRRSELEGKLQSLLVDDRHPLVTLHGRGGVGKTWLALETLHEVAESGRFEMLLWFSARDVDLKLHGPITVKRQVLTIDDIAQALVDLVAPLVVPSTGVSRAEFLASFLSESPLQGPTLFVLDNFETVRNPAELYLQIEGFVRNPNKILITSRFSDFVADRPLEVKGMTEGEFHELVRGVAHDLAIDARVDDDLIDELYEECDGHPYVARVFLGEIANSDTPLSPKQLLRGRADILQALFERSFQRLAPAARRVFLTLCRWRSLLPEVAVAAVLQADDERVDVDEAVQDLINLSLVEVTRSEVEAEGRMRFLAVPLVALTFGEGKLKVDAMRPYIESDLEFLRLFGPVRAADVKNGVGPRIKRAFSMVSSMATDDRALLPRYKPLLEYIASRYPEAWLYFADLNEERGDLRGARECLAQYLQGDLDVSEELGIWKRYREISEQIGDFAAELNACLQIVDNLAVTFSDASKVAGRVMTIWSASSEAVPLALKRRAATSIVQRMETDRGRAAASDFSRMAWLYINLSELEKARGCTKSGLAIDPNNYHCRKLAERLALPLDQTMPL